MFTQLTAIIFILMVWDTGYCQIQTSSLSKATLKFSDKNLEINGNLEDVELSTGAQAKIIDGQSTPLVLDQISINCKHLIFSVKDEITIKGTVSIAAREIEFTENLNLKFEGSGAKLFLSYSDHLSPNGKTIKVAISDYMKFACEKRK